MPKQIRKSRPIIFVLCTYIFFCDLQSNAQQSNGLQHLLNTVDSQSNWSRTPVSGAPAIPQQNINSPLINQNNPFYARQQILRTLFSGGSSQPQNNKKDWSSSTAYSDWQQAENDASRAHDAAERARYYKDKGDRQSAASEAYYAAQSARQASDRVYYASERGDPTGQQYVGSARAAADRAQADADNARYNADRDD